MAKESYILIKEQNHLVAANPWTFERLDKFPEGVELKAATLTVARSLPFQGFYWVMLTNICKATEVAPSSTHLHKALLKLCKYVKIVYNTDGEPIEMVEDSTAFDEMNQPEFFEYVEQAKRALAEHVGVVWDDYTREAA